MNEDDFEAMKILIEEYNPQWKIKFLNEKKNIQNALSGIKLEIEHIGSTAVQGLGAKPVIDILIGLYDFSVAGKQVEKLIELGYQYVQQFEDTMPERRFFKKEVAEVRTHHIHMVEINTEFWIRHIAFRDHLIRNSSTRLAYYNLKKELSLREWKDGNEYAAAKSEFIKSVEKSIL